MTEEQLLLQEQRRRDCMVHRHAGELAPLLADNLSYVHTNGVVDRKEDVLRKLLSGEIQYRAIGDEVTEAWVSGGFGLIRSTLLLDLVVGGQAKTMRCSTVGVWGGKDGAWLLQYYCSRKLEDELR